MVRSLFIFSTIALLSTACSSVKPAASKNTVHQSASKESSVTFLDNISINPGTTGTINTSTTARRDNNKADDVHAPGIEKYSPLQFKYAILTKAPVEQMRNEKLLNFMDDWYGAPYHYGGTTKDGIDCSAFVSQLMSSVYSINNLPRISKDQYNGCRHISRDELQEGDLVFFHTLSKRKIVSHVGVYLCNNKFVHASISGVVISDMEEGYYAQRFVGAGRVRE